MWQSWTRYRAWWEDANGNTVADEADTDADYIRNVCKAFAEDAEPGDTVYLERQDMCRDEVEKYYIEGIFYA